MSDIRQYKPIFKGEFPSDVRVRWETIRQFISHWCLPLDTPLPDKFHGESQLFAQANSACGEKLSYSIGQWLSLVENALEMGAPQIRDIPVFQPVEDFFDDKSVGHAVAILESGESDVYWAVEQEKLQDDDPPVQIFQDYDPSSPAFLGTVSSVSEFTLKYICAYNEFSVGNTEWFSADGTKRQVQEIIEWFDYSLTIKSDGLFDKMELLESTDIAAIVNGNRIEVSVFCDPGSIDLPPFLKSEMQEHVEMRKQYES